ncbi:MAG: hypothetical protein HYV17_14125 [Xanthomonadales bacterium]|nr:hypothetical protein [Xanthomonadales bacterium]
MKTFFIALALMLASDAVRADACDFVRRTLWPQAPHRELELYPDEAESNLIPSPWVPSSEVIVRGSATIHWQKEAIFDFDNDGMVDRVLLSDLTARYLWGSVILVQHGASSTSFVARDPDLDGNWLLPCQLDRLRPEVQDCPLFSQRSDGAELIINKADGSTSAFPVRYSQVVPFVFDGTTYLAVQTSNGRDGERGIGVVKTSPNRNFAALCVVHGNAIFRAAP